jgi:hypothetical protein
MCKGCEIRDKVICFLIALMIFLTMVLTGFLNPKRCFAMDFKEYINSPIITEKTSKELRIEWNSVFGFDVFKSYFAVKDLEESFRNYTALDLGKFKGRLKFGDNYKSIEYKFIYKF